MFFTFKMLLFAAFFTSFAALTADAGDTEDTVEDEAGLETAEDALAFLVCADFAGALAEHAAVGDRIKRQATATMIKRRRCLDQIL